MQGENYKSDPVQMDSNNEVELKGTYKEKELKWNGWGFKDSYFFFDENTHVHFAGNPKAGRYHISGHVLPRLRDFIGELGVDITFKTPSQDLEAVLNSIANPIRNDQFIRFLNEHCLQYSMDKKLRLNRAHGHGLAELYALRHGKVARVPDVIVWPKNHDDVVQIVNMANNCNVVIIPHGGGTNVTLGLWCPENETRMIVSLDMAKMNRLLWINPENMTACAEAGIIGIQLEDELISQGYTMGHDPDSIELSTLGGWVSTRASGMKRMKYGNIEDILIGVKIVTPIGVYEKRSQAPRASTGPDIQQLILGSEGTFGVITQAIFKVWKKPECVRYGSVVFPTFDNGVKCMKEAKLQKCAPASVRLVDNLQFRTSQGFKEGPLTIRRRMMEQLQHLYITGWKGFDPMEVCAMTLVFEGTKEEVEWQEKHLYKIAASFRGFPGGAANGKNGYMLTLAVAYLRDIGMDHGCVGDCIETALPWDKVLEACNRFKQVVGDECKRIGVIYAVSSRVTQAYDTGACVYSYIGLNYKGLDENPMEAISRIEGMARDVFISAGGTISHHHGVGKAKREWLPAAIGDLGITVLKSVKRTIDPNNIFASGNLFDASSKL